MLSKASKILLIVECNTHIYIYIYIRETRIIFQQFRPPESLTLILRLASSARKSSNELVRLRCTCCSVALLARTCICFVSLSRLHHRRRFRKYRPLRQGARGRFRILWLAPRVPSEADDSLSLSLSLEFFQSAVRNPIAIRGRASVTLAAAARGAVALLHAAREKGRAANCSLLRQISGRSLSRTRNYSSEPTTACV